MLRFLEWLELTESPQPKRIPRDAVKINLPKVEQTKPYSCGAAVLRAVCDYFGVGPDDESGFINLLKTNSNGTMPSDIVRVARGLGLHAFMRQHMTIDSLKSRLEKRIPVICAVQAWGDPDNYDEEWNGHYVVAIGYDDERIYFEDPIMDRHRGFLTYQQFLDRWHDTDREGNKCVRLGISVWRTAPPEKPQRKPHAKVIESLEIT